MFVGIVITTAERHFLMVRIANMVTVQVVKHDVHG